MTNVDPVNVEAVRLVFGDPEHIALCGEAPAVVKQHKRLASCKITHEIRQRGHATCEECTGEIAKGQAYTRFVGIGLDFHADCFEKHMNALRRLMATYGYKWESLEAQYEADRRWSELMRQDEKEIPNAEA